MTPTQIPDGPWVCDRCDETYLHDSHVALKAPPTHYCRGRYDRVYPMKLGAG